MNSDTWVGGISRTESKAQGWHLWATVFWSDQFPDEQQKVKTLICTTTIY